MFYSLAHLIMTGIYGGVSLFSVYMGFATLTGTAEFLGLAQNEGTETASWLFFGLAVLTFVFCLQEMAKSRRE